MQLRSSILINEQVISYYGLGATQHKTDARYEGLGEI